MTTYYVDLVNGNNANDGLSFANRKKDVSAISDPVAGDEIRVMKSEGLRSLGVDLACTYLSGTVTLGSALNATIYEDGAWTAATNVTCTAGTDRKSGSSSAQMAIAAGFTTGKAAYFVTGELDLSGYEQISFWIKTNQTLAANLITIKLCSDTAGATPVDELTISHQLTASRWVPIVLDKGSALGSSIQSVALYCDTDPGTVTINIDNMVACKASSTDDALTHRDLIGHIDDPRELYPIRSISGTTIILDAPVHASGAPDTPRGWSRPTATATGYRRRPFFLGYTALVSVNSITSLSGSNSGTSSSPIVIRGGYDETDMSTVDGDTLVSGAMSGYYWGHGATTRTWIHWYNVGAAFVDGIRPTSASNVGVGQSRFNCAAYAVTTANGVFVAPASSQIIDCLVVATNMNVLWTTFSSAAPRNTLIENLKMRACGFGSSSIFIGADIPPLTTRGLEVINCTPGLLIDGNIEDCVFVDNSFANGMQISAGGGTGGTVKNLTSTNGSGAGVYIFGGNWIIRGLTTSGNSSGAILINDGEAIIYNAELGESTKVSFVGSRGRVILERPAHNPDNWEHYYYTGTINLQSSVVPADIAKAIEYSPNHASCTQFEHALGRQGNSAVKFPLLSEGGATTEHSFQFRRSNTGLTGRWIVYGGQYPGIDTDVIVDLDMDADTWETKTMTLSPDENCVIESFVEWYHNGITTYKGYVAGPYIAEQV